MENDVVARIRNFNRFYVRIIGLLEKTILNSGYSLTEAHVMNVLYNHPDSTATHINQELKLDEGYLSRVIKKLIKLSLVRKAHSPVDKRAFVLALTTKGRGVYEQLDRASSELVASTIAHLNDDQKVELAELLDRASGLFSK